MEFTKGSTWTHSTQFISKISAISHKCSILKLIVKEEKKTNPFNYHGLGEIETEFLYEAQVGLELAL